MSSKPYDQTRAFEVTEFKSLGGTKGEFEAIVSVFGNVDYGGDRVAPTAFDKTLAKWGESGDPIPIIWNHMWDNPEAHIGEADPNDVVPNGKGLHVKRGVLDVDKPFAGQVQHLLERRRVKEFSFGYNLIDSERAKDGALDLLEIDLFEIGPTLKGMNPATELLAVKALAAVIDDEPGVVAAVKAGARHSKETLAALQRMRAELDSLIAAGEPADETNSDDGKALGTPSDPDADLMADLNLLKAELQ